MLEQSVPEGLHPIKRTHAGAVREEQQPVGRIHIGEVHGRLSERDPTLQQGQNVKSSPPEEEGETETTCDALTTTPLPRPPCTAG